MRSIPIWLKIFGAMLATARVVHAQDLSAIANKTVVVSVASAKVNAKRCFFVALSGSVYEIPPVHDGKNYGFEYKIGGNRKYVRKDRALGEWRDTTTATLNQGTLIMGGVSAGFGVTVPMSTRKIEFRGESCSYSENDVPGTCKVLLGNHLERCDKLSAGAS
jgi:hypothetical protein